MLWKRFHIYFNLLLLLVNTFHGNDSKYFSFTKRRQNKTEAVLPTSVCIKLIKD